MDWLIFLTSSEGVNLLLTAFVPGFVTISLSNHFFQKLKMNDIEMVFWSIPLSLALIFGYYIAIIFIFDGSQPNVMVTELTAFLGANVAFIVFIPMYIIYTGEKAWRLKDRHQQQFSQFVFIFFFESMWLIAVPSMIGMPALDNPLVFTRAEWIMFTKGIILSAIFSAIAVYHKELKDMDERDEGLVNILFKKVSNWIKKRFKYAQKKKKETQASKTI